MSTITVVNNGDTGLVARNAINQNFANLNGDKLEAAAIANFETTTQLNARDTANRDRTNHTGTQLAATISDFSSSVTALLNWVDDFTASDASAIQNTVVSDISGQLTGALTFDGINWDITTVGRTASGIVNFLNFKKDGSQVFAADIDGNMICTDILAYGTIDASNSSGFRFKNGAASDTVATLLPNQSNSSAGIGGAVGTGGITVITGNLARLKILSGGDVVVESGKLYSNIAQSWALDNASSSTINPTLVPNRGNFGNGVGGTTSRLSLIASSLEALGFDSSLSAFFNGVIFPKSYTIATLPTATIGGFIFISDETGGATIAYADGTNWRRVSDGAIAA